MDQNYYFEIQNIFVKELQTMQRLQKLCSNIDRDETNVQF